LCEKEERFRWKRNGRPIDLSRVEVAALFNNLQYHHSNDKEVAMNSPLDECYRSGFNGAAADQWYLDNLLGQTLMDKFGRKIEFDEHGGLFLYKTREDEPELQKHVKDPSNYRSYRGRKLPWIPHTIKNTTNIYERIDEYDNLELMYVNKYAIPPHIKDELPKMWYVVIVKKYRKDTNSPFRFKTAFPISRYNGFLKRLTQYRPVTKIKDPSPC
jgi:hypothetical protein